MDRGNLQNLLADYDWSSLSEALRDIADMSRHCTTDEGGRIPTWPLIEAAKRLEWLEDELAKLWGDA